MPATHPRALRHLALFGLIVGALACSLTLSTDAAQPPVQLSLPTPAPTAVPFTPNGPALDVTVSAAQGWQATGTFLEAGQKLKIEEVTGKITDLKVTLTNGDGYNYVCGHANCCEPLPTARRDALLGRVGDTVFLIGNGGVFTVVASGELALRINDCDEGLYDNDGQLTVRLYQGR